MFVQFFSQNIFINFVQSVVNAETKGDENHLSEDVAKTMEFLLFHLMGVSS